jgi:hypothetical protein
VVVHVQNRDPTAADGIDGIVAADGLLSNSMLQMPGQRRNVVNVAVSSIRIVRGVVAWENEKKTIQRTGTHRGEVKRWASTATRNLTTTTSKTTTDAAVNTYPGAS